MAFEGNKTFREYITEYQFKAKNAEIDDISEVLGVDKNRLRNLMTSGLTESNINEFGRFDDLKSTVNKDKARAYFEKIEGVTIPAFKVNIKVHNLLKRFVLVGGFEIELPSDV